MVQDARGCVGFFKIRVEELLLPHHTCISELATRDIDKNMVRQLEVSLSTVKAKEVLARMLTVVILQKKAV